MPSTLTNLQRIEKLERELFTLASLTMELATAHTTLQGQLLDTLSTIERLGKTLAELEANR